MEDFLGIVDYEFLVGSRKVSITIICFPYFIYYYFSQNILVQKIINLHQMSAKH